MVRQALLGLVTSWQSSLRLRFSMLLLVIPSHCLFVLVSWQSVEDESVNSSVHQILSAERGLETYLGNFEHLFDIIDYLDQTWQRVASRLIDRLDLSTAFIYLQSILIHSPVLEYFDPRLHDEMNVFRGLYQKANEWMFHFLDTSMTTLEREHALVFIPLVQEDIKMLGSEKIMEEEKANHVIDILQNRWNVLCAQYFALDHPKKSVALKMGIVKLLKFFNRTTSIPPLYLETEASLRWDFTFLGSLYPPVQWSEMQPCLFRSHPVTSSGETNESDNCFCGWISHSFPQGVLTFFNSSMISVASVTHTYIRNMKSSLNLNEPHYRKDILLLRLLVLRKTLSFVFSASFCYLDGFIKHFKLKFPGTAPTSQLNTERQQILKGIIGSSVHFVLNFLKENPRLHDTDVDFGLFLGSFNHYSDHSSETDLMLQCLGLGLVDLFGATVDDDYRRSLLFSTFPNLNALLQIWCQKREQTHCVINLEILYYCITGIQYLNKDSSSFYQRSVKFHC